MTLPRRSMTACVLALAFAANGPVRAHGEAARTRPGPVTPEQTDWGIAGDAAQAGRTVQVRMSDAMRFTPERLLVRRGETLRIVIHNDGKLLHEFVLGSAGVLERHAALMRRFPDMEHDEPYLAHVPAGATREIVWSFNRAGEFEFACLIPGHYEAGMKGKVLVRQR